MSCKAERREKNTFSLYLAEILLTMHGLEEQQKEEKKANFRTIFRWN
jgi:hypothetical protein